MFFTKEDYSKLEKIGINSLLDLCLCIPKGYTDLSPITQLKLDSIGTLKIIVKSQKIITSTFYSKTPILKIITSLPDFNNEEFSLTIFNYKSFHKSLFETGKELIVYGKIQMQNYNRTLFMNQPQIVTKTDIIKLNFKTQKIKSATLQKITQEYITAENLIKHKIPQKFITPIIDIFHPNKKFLHFFHTKKTFPKESITALKFLEIYQYIQKISKKRYFFSPKFICKTPYNDFIKSLPFTLTNSQAQAIAEIAQDLQSDTAARRIIMGDVGCGKTIVILASVVMAYPYQSLLMVPTTILAQQIFEEAKKFLPDYIQITCITGKSKIQEFQNFHFIIGTQALLHRQIDSQNLALIMTDEQHRFGTNQRHYLEKMAEVSSEDSLSKNTKKPHYLQFSATPIPRTLSMINANMINFSFIKDLPYKKDIDTIIIEKNNFSPIIKHIENEIKQNHQSVIVYPLVEESENINYRPLSQSATFWQKRFKKVYVTFGADKEKEDVLAKFRDDGNILLATTLIEVGISLPRLSTIVIVAPERMGLATLHQLRGRVSRNGLKGYCFLCTNTPSSTKLREFAAHLSGFDIAEIDLKYRSGGDLLSGKKQSGASFVFFDLQQDEQILQEAQNILNT
ncbi:ATP-dependent DNA helicase RecG [Helicobacter anatolicus]|uniref:ATP-dependent DNA helicase RecG n=1 Tax=Helicobacter anatolicus TaxID=2905874 RepID=UPI001E3C0EA6|nr:ATP-dependent DNA helicase RecG [Helicobacter anatolicus]MCE3037810.1 ATP-dependent DNA helicase RecG [Helicobacter anatolicus]